MDLIDRLAAIDALLELVEARRTWKSTEDARKEISGIDASICAIHDLPSAQPEIIRCKECKHYVIHTFFGRSQGWCERLCDEFDKSLARDAEPDDYCSKAEMRDDFSQHMNPPTT